MLKGNNLRDEELQRVDTSGYARPVGVFDSFGRAKDKELALELTKLCLNNFGQSFGEPLEVFKRYWRELATMV